MLGFWLFSAFMAFASAIYHFLTGRLRAGMEKLASAEAQPVPVNSGPDSWPMISIIVAARNEEENLPRLLPRLLAQDYPQNRFEILVVDDRSTDATPAILAKWATDYPGRIQALRVEDKPRGVSPKKYALSLAMEKARGDIWFTTDADCLMPDGWLKALMNRFTVDTGLVLGLTTYRLPDQPTYWDRVIALEFASYAFVAAALVGLGFPVHGNANNLAYRQKAYRDQKEKDDHAHLVSGDDDFLLQGIHATGHWKIAYAITPGSAVFTAPPENLRHFWEQRKRWAGKCLHYRPLQLAFLAAIFAYYLGITFTILYGLVDFRWLPAGLFLFGWKTGSDWQFMRLACNRFGKRDLMGGFLGAALLHIPLIIAAVFAGSFGGFTWKGQQMRTRAD